MTLNFMGLTHATKVALTVVFMVIFMIAGLGVEYLMITRVIADSNAQWCDTLSLLISRPVAKPADPRANPSRMATYLLYEDFVHLRDKFGCG